MAIYLCIWIYHLGPTEKGGKNAGPPAHACAYRLRFLSCLPYLKNKNAMSEDALAACGPKLLGRRIVDGTLTKWCDGEADESKYR